jgi:acetyl esterase
MAVGVRVRRKLSGLALEGLFKGVSALGRVHPKAKPEAHGLEVIRDVPYRDSDSPDHLLDVWRPVDRTEPLPVVLYIHGGGFRILSKDTHWIMATAYARRGMVVFNINYRLAPKHPYPAGVEDALAALPWVVDHAAEYGGDPTRIVLAGESAGANLATVLAVATSYRRPEPAARAIFDREIRPRAVVPHCGLHQVSDTDRFRRRGKLRTFVTDRMDEIAIDYFRGCGSMTPAERELADPLVILERGETPARPLPPFLLTVGTRDPILDDTRRLAAALERLGADVDARYYLGEAHAFKAFVWRPNARKAWGHTYAFLNRTVGPVTHHQ